MNYVIVDSASWLQHLMLVGPTFANSITFPRPDCNFSFPTYCLHLQLEACEFAAWAFGQVFLFNHSVT